MTGDVLHVSVFGNHVVVINSLKMAEEVFERRAQLYSDRPADPDCRSVTHFPPLVFPCINPTSRAGWEYNTGLLRYGDVWRQHRKICWQNFHNNAAHKYHPIERERVHFFLRSVLQEPETVFEQNKLYVLLINQVSALFP
jgi:cytochrome P450